LVGAVVLLHFVVELIPVGVFEDNIPAVAALHVTGGSGFQIVVAANADQHRKVCQIRTAGVGYLVFLEGNGLAVGVAAKRIGGVFDAGGRAAAHRGPGNGNVGRFKGDGQGVASSQVAEISCQDAIDRGAGGNVIKSAVKRNGGLPLVHVSGPALRCSLTWIHETVIVDIHYDFEVGKIAIDNSRDCRKLKLHLCHSQRSAGVVGQLKGKQLCLCGRTEEFECIWLLSGGAVGQPDRRRNRKLKSRPAIACRTADRHFAG